MSVSSLREITSRNEWATVARSLLAGGEPAFPIEVFDTYWIEAGHRIREQVADDAVLAAMLRQVLKPYSGPGVVLYRGENIARWRAGTVGFAWTQEFDVAEMFGAGLNAIHSGGVLLRGAFEPPAIISGPNDHSSYLQEGQYTIDPNVRVPLIELKRYPPVR
jgi:hypothetical protein